MKFRRWRLRFVWNDGHAVLGRRTWSGAERERAAIDLWIAAKRRVQIDVLHYKRGQWIVDDSWPADALAVERGPARRSAQAQEATR